MSWNSPKWAWDYIRNRYSNQPTNYYQSSQHLYVYGQQLYKGTITMTSDYSGGWYWAPDGTEHPEKTSKTWGKEWQHASQSDDSPYYVDKVPRTEVSWNADPLSPITTEYKYILRGYPYASPKLPPIITIGWQASDDAWRTIFQGVNVATGEIHDGYVHYSLDFTTDTPRKNVEGAYRGWRKWGLSKQGVLKGLVRTEYEWTPGWNDAKGYLSRRGGRGGFYVVNTIQELVQQEANLGMWLDGTHVYGSCLLAGRTRIGTLGARSTLGKPESIILTGNLDTDVKLLTVAEKYNLKIHDNLGNAMAIETGPIKYSEEGQ